MTPHRTSLVVIALLLFLLGSRPVGAADRLEAGKQVGRAAIDRRLTVLSGLATRVQQAPRITTADRGQLSGQLQAQSAGLTALRSKIDGDTSPAVLRADLVSIVNGYRVYVLTVPKTRGVAVADLEEAAADRLEQLSGRLQTAIDKASAQGKDVTKAKADLDALRAKVAAVRPAVQPVPAALLALQPAGYPGNRATLESVRVTLRAQRAPLRDAVALARQVVSDLKG